MSNSSQFKLLGQRRYLPFFLTQFFGAFNDNVYKNALVILITYKLTSQADLLVNLAAGLFILPFFLFSALAGQIAEKFEKSKLIKFIKLLELTIMSLATLGFYLDSIPLLIVLLFLMGTQSTFFGPVKYGYLPQHLRKDELVGGNALVEASTFISILLGTILGGILISFESLIPISFAVLLIAALGLLSSTQIPKTASQIPDLKINFNIFSSTYENIKILPQNRVVFLSILAISWFWFYGSVFLMQIPNFASKVLNGNELVVTLLLSMFSVGIGIGSLLCEKMSGQRVEIGLVPLGAIGLSWFGYDLAASASNWAYASAEILSPQQFWNVEGSFRILFNLVMIGVSGGLYIVPLYALLQERSEKSQISRVIAGNNIINSLFMVLAAVLAIVVLSTLGYSIPDLFIITVCLNVLVSIYIFTVVPEFLMRLVVWFLISTIYRVKPKGMENIPAEGPALLACNHISFVDPLILGGYIKRPVRFVMYYKIYNIPILRWIFKAAKTIPIAGYKEDPKMYERAFESIKEALDDGDVVCIFPEGQLTPDGTIQEFKGGIEKIVNETPIDVIPMALFNLWGSFFSRQAKRVVDRRPKKLFAKISIHVGEPIAIEDVSKEKVQQEVERLKQEIKEIHHSE